MSEKEKFRMPSEDALKEILSGMNDFIHYKNQHMEMQRLAYATAWEFCREREVARRRRLDGYRYQFEHFTAVVTYQVYEGQRPRKFFVRHLEVDLKCLPGFSSLGPREDDQGNTLEEAKSKFRPIDFALIPYTNWKILNEDEAAAEFLRAWLNSCCAPDLVRDFFHRPTFALQDCCMRGVQHYYSEWLKNPGRIEADVLEIWP